MLTSGGDCQSLNATMRGIGKALYRMYDDVQIYGFNEGYRGLMYEDYRIMEQEDFSGLLVRGGTILGTSRTPFKLINEPDAYGNDKVEMMKQTYRKLRLDGLIVLGGNGSLKTANLLSQQGLKVVAAPKTIDNDLALTDHSVGYPSAARHIMDAAMMALLDVVSFRNGKVIFMETMGRNTGWLTASVALLPKSIRPDAFYLPEQKWDTDEFLKNIQAIYAKKRSAVIVLSEGVPLEKRNHEAVDSFGHASLEGVSGTAADLVAAKLGLHSRVISDTSLQRSDAFSITKVDRQEAIAVGQFAVRALCQGVSGKMVALKRVSSKPYHAECVLVDLDEVADAVRALPTSWILSNHEMAPEFIDYLAPLVKETETVQYEDGFLRMPHLKFISVK